MACKRGFLLGFFKLKISIGVTLIGLSISCSDS
jgi:hypothetical protein